MNDNLIPDDPFEVIRDHGAFHVRRNNALVAEVLAIKERIARIAFNEQVTVSKAA